VVARNEAKDEERWIVVKGMVIEISTMDQTPEKLEHLLVPAEKMVAEKGGKLGLQVHNSAGEEIYRYCRDTGLPLSLHLPLLVPDLINLACNDNDLLIEQFKEVRSRIEEADSRIGLFHGFLMTDKKVPNDPVNYRKIMLANIDPRFSLEDGLVMNPDFLCHPEMETWIRRVKTGLQVMAGKLHGLDVALENDFPGIGSGFQRIEEFHRCGVRRCWLDLGHLWASSVLHGFDFLKMVETWVGEIEVAGVHVHSNLIKRDTPAPLITEHHAHLHKEGEMPVGDAVKILKKHGVKRFTLEIRGTELADVELLCRWLSV